MNPSMSMSAFYASVDNPTPARNVYPTASGATLGSASAGASLVSTSVPATGSAAADGASDSVAMTGGLIGQPLTWWVTLIGLFLLLGFTAKKLDTGESSNFANVRLSGYNILMISFAAIIGIGFFKVVFTKWQVPGLSTFIGAI